MVPARRFPMVEVEKLPKLEWKTVEVAWVEVERLNVCPPVQVLALARFKEATTAPVVGETVRVPSLLETEVTPLVRQEPPMAKHPAARLTPLVNDEVPVPWTLMTPVVSMTPDVVVARPTPSPPVR